MVVAVIDPLAASPVLLPHTLAFSPFVMPHILVSIVVIVPPIIAVILGKNRTEGKSGTHQCECNGFMKTSHATTPSVEIPTGRGFSPRSLSRSRRHAISDAISAPHSS
jgi:hypothetical protein